MPSTVSTVGALEAKSGFDLYRLFGHACQRLRCFRIHADDDRRGDAMSNPSARRADELRRETADIAAPAEAMEEFFERTAPKPEDIPLAA